MKRALGGLIVGALLVDGLIACGGNPQDSQVVAVVDTPTIVQNANVTIGLLDVNGIRRGTCSGVLIGPRLVLTAGHCIAGKNSWAVQSAQGTKTTGIRGFTADWLDFESSAAHPAHHDFGVIQLQSDITLTTYPKLATTEAASAAELVRIRNVSGSSFEARTAFANPIDGFPHGYMTGMASDEALDTGGAVLDDKGNVVGVISGQGTTTENLYIARIDTHFVWLYSKVQCSTPSDESDDSTASAGQVGIQCNSSSGGDSGSGGSSCSSGGSSGGSSGSSCSGGSSGGSSCSSGGSSGSSSGGDSSGGSGGSTCQDSGGNCSGDCPSGGGGSVTGSDGSTTDTSSSTGGGSSGSGGSGSGTSTGSNSGSSGGSSGSDNGGSGSGSSTGSNSGSNTGSNTGSSGSGSGSNAGSNAGSTMNGGSSGSSSGSGSNTGSNTGGTGSLVGNNSGSNTNTNSGGSTGSTTGSVGSNIPTSVIIDSCQNGGCPDDTIDYGDCGCTNTGGGTTTVK